MRTDKEMAKNMRLNGLSYRAINKQLGVSLATLSIWFKDDPSLQAVSDTQKENNKGISRERIQVMNAARKTALKNGYEKSQLEAERQFVTLKKNPLFIAGLSLYWASGDAAHKYNVKVSSADPGIVALHKAFLLSICKVDESRIKSCLILYPDLNEMYCKRYWIAAANLNSANFTKSIIIKGRHKTRKVAFGICSLGTSDGRLKVKVMTWVKLFSRDMLLKNAGMV